MRQLEALLGETAFRDGVRSYLRGHAFGNATWDDLIAALAGHTKPDLKRWSRMWVDEPGRPLIRTDLEIVDGRVQRLALQQHDPQGKKRMWPQQLRVTVGCGPQPRRIVVELTDRSLRARLKAAYPTTCWPVARGGAMASSNSIPARRRTCSPTCSISATH
jgi:aminopeptidase N